MTDAVYDFKSIKRILDRQEQKAEYEVKNPPEPSMYGWPYGVAVPYGANVSEAEAAAANYAFWHGIKI